MIVEPAGPADIDAIDEIERHSFPIPWPRSTWEEELAKPHARLDVVRDAPDRAVIGFCNYWLLLHELHVLAIAAHPDARRRGIGGVLLARALAAGEAHGVDVATLEVRKGNAPAIALYQRHGFRVVHTRARYYQDNDEDALVMLRGMGAPKP
ncbi:MAG TPA: ribosomal protein S18-alanine N-acetyltransferase [Kofleriaceae bacterium]|jgi:ribosomal-protein-alanine N-acetyltransferase